MQTTSADFAEAVIKGYTVATHAEILDSGTVVSALEITQGNTNFDKTNDIRARATVDLADPDQTLVPSDATDLLAPYGNEFKLYRGIDFLDGSDPELVPLGVFGIEDTSVEDSGETISIHLEGLDRAARIQRARLTTEYVVSQGTNYVTAIEDLLTSRWADITFIFTVTTETTPKLVFATGDDPWQQAQKMADAIGYQVYFDGNGVCNIVPEPNPSGIPSVWDYSEGEAMIMLSGTRRQTRDGIRNHFVVTGESTDNASPVRAEAFDDDVYSPTYYLGKFGDVPEFFSSQFITTVEQAQAAANKRLYNMKGRQEDLRFNQVVNPAHEVGDVITVTRQRMGLLSATYVLDKITIPMVASRAMDVQTRRIA